MGARARRILGEMTDLAAAARSAGVPLGGELRLGAIPTLAPYYLPRVLPVDEPGLDHAAVFDEPFAVALPAGHPLTARAALEEGDLAGERLLLLEEGHCFRDQALAVCRLHGRPERDGFSGTSLNTLCEMVAGRVGITLLPALARSRAPEGVETRPFAGPQPARRIGLAWRKGSPRGVELQQLAAYLRQHLPDGVAAAEE